MMLVHLQRRRNLSQNGEEKGSLHVTGLWPRSDRTLAHRVRSETLGAASCNRMLALGHDRTRL
jgi:hypothetical protein